MLGFGAVGGSGVTYHPSLFMSVVLKQIKVFPVLSFFFVSSRLHIQYEEHIPRPEGVEMLSSERSELHV